MSRRSRKKLDAQLSRDKKRNILMSVIIKLVISLIAVIVLIEIIVIFHSKNIAADKGADVPIAGTIGKIIYDRVTDINKACELILTGKEEWEHSIPWDEIKKLPKKLPKRPIATISYIWSTAMASSPHGSFSSA